MIVALSIPYLLSSEKSPEVVNLWNLKSLGYALTAYAVEHEGSFPTAISELPIESIPAERRQFRDFTTNVSKDWIYYQHHTLNDPPETILAASPATVRWRGKQQRRIILNVDTVTTFIDESEFQKRLASEALNYKNKAQQGADGKPPEASQPPH